MIDLHSHILPGIDDGPQSPEEAVALARELVSAGTTVVAATPHVRDDYPTTPETMEAGVAALRSELRRAGVALEIVHGGELDIDRLQTLTDEAVVRFSYAQRGRYVLVEFPYRGWPIAIEPTVERLRRLGLAAVVAHPERSREVQERPERIRSLTEVGALVQVTSSSLTGRFGRHARRCCERLLTSGLVDLVASDAHGTASGRHGLDAAVDAIKDAGVARHVTEDAPAAILAGEPPPPRPLRRSRRFNLG